jgi:hypothetical protein
MSPSDLEKFAALSGWLNELPFGVAPPRTLEIARPSTGWGEEKTHLQFHYYPEPLPEIESSDGLSHWELRGGPRRRSTRCIDFITVPWFVFPADQIDLEAMKSGKRVDAVIPVHPDFTHALHEGTTRVTFLQSERYPYGGDRHYVRDGDYLTVKVERVKDLDYRSAGHKIYSIAWDPHEVAKQSIESR